MGIIRSVDTVQIDGIRMVGVPSKQVTGFQINTIDTVSISNVVLTDLSTTAPYFSFGINSSENKWMPDMTLIMNNVNINITSTGEINSYVVSVSEARSVLINGMNIKCSAKNSQFNLVLGQTDKKVQKATINGVSMMSSPSGKGVGV